MFIAAAVWGRRSCWAWNCLAAVQRPDKRLLLGAVRPQ